MMIIKLLSWRKNHFSGYSRGLNHLFLLRCYEFIVSCVYGFITEHISLFDRLRICSLWTPRTDRPGLEYELWPFAACHPPSLYNCHINKAKKRQKIIIITYK